MLWITGVLGTCFLGVRWGLRDAQLLWFAALRALVGGGALAVVAGVQRRPLPRSAASWASISLLGVVNVSLAFTAMFAGIAGLATGTAAVLANAQPLLILLPAWWLFGERVPARTCVGLAVGFAGLLVVALPGGGGSGALLSLLAAAAVTGGTLLVRLLHGADIVVASAAHLLIGGLVLAGAALAADGPPQISWTWRFVAIVAFLGVGATAATTLAWFVETQRCPLSSLTPWLLLVPVFGLLIGTTVLGERPDGWTFTGIVLVLASLRMTLTEHHAPGAGPGHLHLAQPSPAPHAPLARPTEAVLRGTSLTAANAAGTTPPALPAPPRPLPQTPTRQDPDAGAAVRR